jgi:hypothetical protein
VTSPWFPGDERYGMAHLPWSWLLGRACNAVFRFPTEAKPSALLPARPACPSRASGLIIPDHALGLPVLRALSFTHWKAPPFTAHTLSGHSLQATATGRNAP